MHSTHYTHYTMHTIHYMQFAQYTRYTTHYTLYPRYTQQFSREMVVGHVRQELDWDDCDDLEDCDNDVISLTMFQPSVTRDQVVYSSY